MSPVAIKRSGGRPTRPPRRTGIRQRQNTRKASLIWGVARVAIIVVILVVALVPFVIMVLVSISPEGGYTTLGTGVTMDNYRVLFATLPFAHYARNSLLVASITALSCIAIGSPAAYVLARFAFRGRKTILLGMLLLYMIPTVVLVVPLLLIYHRFGLYNSITGLVLANTTSGLPFAIWVLTGFFATIPSDLEEAARVDGCNRMSALMRIVMPLAFPGIIATGLLVFIFAWNDFLFAFALTSGDGVRTLPVALRPFIGGEGGTFWGAIMAGAVVTTLPVLVLFLVFQRYLVSGLAGAVKG